jgi:hypothetical protein
LRTAHGQQRRWARSHGGAMGGDLCRLLQRDSVKGSR